MTTIKGDLLDITEGIICHQVNCQRVAGAGLALQIRVKWPMWFAQFKAIEPKLGNVWVWRNGMTNLFVASLYAQEFYGSGLQTSYGAFESALANLEVYLDGARRVYLWPFGQIYFPVGIACGNGGAEWNKIKSFIKRRFPNAILVEKL